MASFREAVGDAVRAGVCTLVAEDANVVALLERTGLADNPLAQAGRAFRLSFCNNDTPVGTLPPSSPQGNCDAVVYVGQLQTTRSDGLVQGIETGRIYGPVGGLVFTPASPSGTTIGVRCRGPFPGPIQQPGFLHNFFEDGALTYTSPGINNIIRIDGQPDNCPPPTGSPILPPPAEGPIVRPINITFQNNGDITTNLNGTLRIFAPVLVPIFAPRIPFRLNLGGLTLSGSLNADGTVDLDLDLNIGPGGDKDTPEPPEGDPPDEDTVIIGARVRVVSDTGQTTTVLFNGDRPDLYIPRAGTIQFLQPAGDESAWSADIPIKTSPQWVPCGPPGYGTRIAFTATPGVILSVTAVLGRPPKE